MIVICFCDHVKLLLETCLNYGAVKPKHTMCTITMLLCIAKPKTVLFVLTGGTHDTLHTTLSDFVLCLCRSVCLSLSVSVCLGLSAGIEMHHEAHVCGIRFGHSICFA